MSMEEKLNLVEVMKVSQHGKSLYLRLSKVFTEAYKIEKGNKLRVRIETILER